MLYNNTLPVNIGCRHFQMFFEALNQEGEEEERQVTEPKRKLRVALRKDIYKITSDMFRLIRDITLADIINNSIE